MANLDQSSSVVPSTGGQMGDNLAAAHSNPGPTASHGGNFVLLTLLKQDQHSTCSSKFALASSVQYYYYGFVILLQVRYLTLFLVPDRSRRYDKSARRSALLVMFEKYQQIKLVVV